MGRRDQRAGRRVLLFRFSPCRNGVAASSSAGQLAELFLCRRQFARGNGEQPFDRERNPLLQAQLLLEPVAAETERPLGIRPDVVLEVIDVGANRPHRLGARIVQVAKQVNVIDIREGARQVFPDKRHGATPGIDADLHEDGRRILDVVARGLHETRHLAQFREHPARPVGFGRVGEDRLGGQTRGQDVGVDVRVALPRARGFQIELPGPDVRRDNLVLNLFPKRQVRVRNAVEPPGEAGKGTRVTVNGRTPEVL